MRDRHGFNMWLGRPHVVATDRNKMICLHQLFVPGYTEDGQNRLSRPMACPLVNSGARLVLEIDVVLTCG